MSSPKNISDREVRNKKSVNGLVSLLRKVIKGNHRPSDELVEALKSQGAMASYSDGASIISMSLNTQKKYAEELLGSYDDLDKLRTSSLELTQRRYLGPQRSNKRDKVGLKLRVEELEERLQKSSQDNMLLTIALAKALNLCALLAKKDRGPAADALMVREMEKIQRITHGSKAIIDGESNVKSIDDARKRKKAVPNR